MAWIVILICIYLLPFFSPEVFKISSLFLYGALSVSLLFFSMRTKTFLRDRLILFPAIALLIIVIVTSFLSPHPRVALSNGLYFVFYIMVFAILAALGPGRKRQIALVLMGSSFFISVQGLLQRFFYFDRIIPYIISHRPLFEGKELLYILDITANQRIVSMFCTPNLLASYLVMVNLIIFGHLFTSRNRKAVFVLLALLIVNSLSLWFTRSFWGLTSFIFGLLLLFIMMFIKRKRQFRYANRLLVPLAVVFLALFIILLINRCFYANSAYNLSFALQGRMQFWKAALRAIADRPLSSAGLGNFGYLYPIYAPTGEVESIMAHNLFLQLWIEIGPYGLVAFIVFLAMLIFKSIRDKMPAEASATRSTLQTACLCSVCAFLFHNMADFSFFIPQTATIWWILCALSIGPRHS